MKKEHFSRFGSMLLTLTLVTSCQKQSQELNPSSDNTFKSSSLANVEHSCRLLENRGLSDGFLMTYHYNDNGLADEYNIFDYSATMEYNNRKLMSKAKFTFGDGVFYDIVFTYEKDKLVMETWYEAGTTDIFDYLVNTYNTKGQLVKRDDPPNNYYSIFKYDNIGNLTSIEVIDYEGALIYGAEFSYNRPVKNPIASVTGRPVALFFADDHYGGPNRFTGVRYYSNDDEGNREVFFNWESAETEITSGAQHYAIYQNSRDVISDTWTDQTWAYENCSGNSESSSNMSAVSGTKTNTNLQYFFRYKSENLRKTMKEIQEK